MAGVSTGERIPGKLYRAVVEGAANAHKVTRIARDVGISRSTVQAIINRESALIGQRKQILAEQFLRIAKRGADRIEDSLDDMPIGQLPTTVGIVTDKVIALTSDPASQPADQHLHLHLQSRDIAREFNEFLAAVERRGLTSKHDDNAVQLQDYTESKPTTPQE